MDNLIPDYIIDTFYIRINIYLINGCKKDSPQVNRELNRIKIINGDQIPEKIKELLK